ncbi:MAG: tetratricopeptide repeat protein [Thermoplasmata archaeon]
MHSLSTKIGRNDPCPCGSGMKSKKCCLRKNRIGVKVFPRDLLAHAADWILDQPELRSQFESVLDEYLGDDVVGDIEISTLLDAFIFDHELSDGKKPFANFLEKADISPKKYSAYRDLEDNVFSMFEVLEVYRGQGLKLQDLVWNKRYFVREKKGTYQMEPGNILFCRVAQFRSYHVIITPIPMALPQDAGYYIKRKLRHVRSNLQKEGMNAFDVLNVVFKPEAKPESLDDIKNALKRKLNSLGLRLDFRGLNRRINERNDVTEAFPEIYEFDFPSNDDFEETMGLLRLLWNKYPRREFGGKSPGEIFPVGPKERSLVSDLLDETLRNIDPEDYSSEEEAEGAMDRFRDKWLKTPQNELDGRCPAEVILQERREKGNPRRDFAYGIQLTPYKDYDENKAESLYMEGVRAFKEGALAKAAELFEEVTDMYPENYKAWGNLGNCLAYLGNKKGAIKCYERSLSLEPGYEHAKRALETVREQTEEQLGIMGVLGALTSAVHRHAKNKGEEIDIWKEIDKELAKTGKCSK